MPQIKVILQQAESNTGVTGSTFGSPISLDGALTVSAQITISNVSSPSGATAILQVSDSPTDVTPGTNDWNDYGSSQAISASGNLFFEKANPSGNWARLKFAIATGSFDAASKLVVKGPN